MNCRLFTQLASVPFRWPVGTCSAPGSDFEYDHSKDGSVPSTTSMTKPPPCLLPINHNSARFIFPLPTFDMETGTPEAAKHRCRHSLSRCRLYLCPHEPSQPLLPELGAHGWYGTPWSYISMPPSQTPPYMNSNSEHESWGGRMGYLPLSRRYRAMFAMLSIEI